MAGLRENELYDIITQYTVMFSSSATENTGLARLSDTHLIYKKTAGYSGSQGVYACAFTNGVSGWRSGFSHMRTAGRIQPLHDIQLDLLLLLRTRKE
ncbi:hypothetical protein IRJ41_009761 [Triplophysa rosa]|uniref:Uncharacterized protein n=1 Tax=Triplophysa rosa TaxID=992332 RepID=A0A9W8C3X6_TRIRA|nr:hypothetical protein IRJ41_009761 [Triplophysa rosa]